MMNPQFRLDLLRQHEHRLADDLRRPRAEPTPPRVSVADVVLRLCRVGDDPVIGMLAALEGRPVPAGRLVLAEVGGEVVAALPLAGGEPLANPFRPTQHLLPLLRLRAAQLVAVPPRPALAAAKAVAARVLQVAR